MELSLSSQSHALLFDIVGNHICKSVEEARHWGELYARIEAMEFDDSPATKKSLEIDSADAELLRPEVQALFDSGVTARWAAAALGLLQDLQPAKLAAVS